MRHSGPRRLWVARAVTAFVACVPAAVVAAVPATQPVSAEGATFFEAKVRPLLAENCFQCHGEKKQKGHLRLDSAAAALRGGDNGPALAPGKPDESRLVAAVSYTDPDLQMPPDKKDRLSAAQVEILTAWVRMGAPWPEGSPLAAPLAKSKRRTITDADRAFWSFQPVKEPVVPTSGGEGWAKNAVDRFVAAKLKAEGLSPAPEADRATLIRRATFDLWGLPPTPDAVRAFVNDPDPGAYEKLIDRLLADPHYGERYARHWLDLVRYAESDGFKQDSYRPDVWPYRDYVIRSLNADKPYDRFVTEQLAGDEVAPGDPDVLVATTYFRHGMYEYNQRDIPKHRAEFLNDITDVTADALLGLGMGCARCHDHKFDPILQSDYFRLQAFFTPLLQRDDLPLTTPARRAEYAAKLAKWEAETADLRRQIDDLRRPAMGQAFTVAFNKLPPDTQAVWHKPPAARTPAERQVAYYIQRQIDDEQKTVDDKIKGADKEKLADLRRQLAAFDADKPKPLPPAFVATDGGRVAPPTAIPGDEAHPLDPGFPVVMDGLGLPAPAAEPSAASTGRRTALARWVTRPDNPLTTRVIANRLWQWHFGRGLVRTSSDFGRLGEPPTHPELLDYLAKQLVESGWSFKAIHRLVMTSATYRQASVRAVTEVAKLKDPDNRWLWRFNARRLDAEQVRDAVLMTSGELAPDAGGPSADFTAPRRTIYTKAVRNNHDPVLDAFDSPESFGSIAERGRTTTATQALLMMNGDWPLKRAAAFAARVRSEAKTDDPMTLAERAYRLAYGRPPTSDELELAVAFLRHPAGGGGGDAAVAKTVAAEPPITQPMPHQGGQAVVIRNASPADLMRLPADRLGVADEFTVEAFVVLESLYPDAGVRVIASQWDGNQAHPGWAFGVTSEKSKHQPRNLILQLAAAGGGYEVVPSDLRLEPHRAYYVAAAVKMKDTGEAGVTFFAKDLTDMDAPLRTAAVRHTLTGSVASASPLILGGRDAPPGGSPQGWDGLLGEVRLSAAALKSDQLLYPDARPADRSAVVGHWQFEEGTGVLKDATGRQKDLVRGKAAGEATTAAPALVDFCHTLLNSNEFLYVD